MVKQFVEERRRWTRADRVLCVEFRLVKSKRTQADKSWALSMTKDMSAKGIAFYTEREFVVGDMLEVRVTMSGILDILKGFARVVRVERKTMGAFYLVGVEIFDREEKPRREVVAQKRTFKKRI